jgi:hypothetical protein
VIRSFALAGAMVTASLAILPGLTSSAGAATVGTTPGRALGVASNVLGQRATQVADFNGDGRADVFA